MPPQHTNLKTSVSTGSSSSPSLLKILGSSYPFMQQVDVVFPSCPALSERLSKLSECYSRGSFTLCAILDAAFNVTGKYALQNDFFVLSLGCVETDDVWCIDHRGVLTLSLTKDTYQRLGLVGEKDGKGSNMRYTVLIDLYERESKVFSRVKESFARWDQHRESQRVGPWQVIYKGSPIPMQGESKSSVEMRQTHESDIKVPSMTISPTEISDEDAKEDWMDAVSDYFEWVGMACMSSERLKANDRASPYVAVYEPPPPYDVGDCNHFAWRGFLTPPFVEQIVSTIVAALQDHPNGGNVPPAFVAITANTYSDSPVTFIPPSAVAEGVKPEARKKHYSKKVWCWSIIAEHAQEDEINWISASVES